MNPFPPGTAILLLDNKKGKPHVWFVLTEPDDVGKVLAVMLVTRKPGRTDDTTVFAPGEYQFGPVAVEGAIDYGEAWLFSVDVLAKKVHDGKAKIRTPLSPALLQRVRAGIRSPYAPNWVEGYYLEASR